MILNNEKLEHSNQKQLCNYGRSVRKRSKENLIKAMDASISVAVALAAAFIRIPERVENFDTAEMDHL